MSGLEPVIRDARRDDLPRIVELLAADQLGKHREDASLPLAPEYYAAFDAMVADPRTRLLVVEAQQRVIGTLQLNFLPGLSRRGAERAQIEAVRIADDMRGRGLGRLLMSEAIEQARLRGCRLVQLTTDLQREEAHRFYQSLGFVHTHAGMKLALEPA
jgi:GNAT superfamily N-acetyltransferase